MILTELQNLTYFVDGRHDSKELQGLTFLEAEYPGSQYSALVLKSNLFWSQDSDGATKRNLFFSQGVMIPR